MELNHIEQLERLSTLGSRRGNPGRPLAQAHGGERPLNDVGDALGGKLEEENQTIPIGNQRLDRLRILGAILRREARPRTRRGTRRTSVRAALARCEALDAGQLVEHVSSL